MGNHTFCCYSRDDYRHFWGQPNENCYGCCDVPLTPTLKPNKNPPLMTDQPASVDERGLNDINRSLGRIEGQLTTLGASLIALATDDKNMNARIERVEGRVNRWVGAAALLSATIAIFGKHLVDRVL